VTSGKAIPIVLCEDGTHREDLFGESNVSYMLDTSWDARGDSGYAVNCVRKSFGSAESLGGFNCNLFIRFEDFSKLKMESKDRQKRMLNIFYV